MDLKIENVFQNDNFSFCELRKTWRKALSMYIFEVDYIHKNI